ADVLLPAMLQAGHAGTQIGVRWHPPLAAQREQACNRLATARDNHFALARHQLIDLRQLFADLPDAETFHRESLMCHSSVYCGTWTHRSQMSVNAIACSRPRVCATTADWCAIAVLDQQGNNGHVDESRPVHH